MARTLAVAAAAGVASASAPAAQSPRIIVEKNVPARMRDGVVLRADIYRPDTNVRLPALLRRTPYSKHPGADDGGPRRMAARGYVVVIQDTRGRYTSDGVAVPHDEAQDGHDTVEWVATLPWVNGKVGMFGSSYAATTQLTAATLRPPHLAAIHPSSSYNSRYDMVFQGGAFYVADGLSWNLGQAADVRRRRTEPLADRDTPIGMNAEERRRFDDEWLWHLPLTTVPLPDLRRDAPGYWEMLAHPSYDAFWRTYDIEARHGDFDVPAQHLTGWYDALLNGTLRNFAGLRANARTARARDGQRLVVGPWTHSGPTARSTSIGDVDYGPNAGFDSDASMFDWFDHWLKDRPTGVMGRAPVRLFIMGTNVWRDEQEWPLARAVPTPFYLRSGGRANTLNGDGTLARTVEASEPADHFTYDPANPVPTGARGGYSRIPSDQRDVERRQDVLVYTSAPLDAPLEVTGPVVAKLWVATDGPDTDFTVKLVDVLPNGTARALTDGILRTRYRKAKTSPLPMTPGVPEEITIDVGATGNTFLAGHRIRVEVSSSNFPRFDRNPNTGAPFGQGSGVRVARQTVLHDATHPSRIELPVIPAAVAPQPRAARLGYSPAAWSAQDALERRFRAAVEAESLSAFHRKVTGRPHPAGSPGAAAVTDSLVRFLRAAGLDVEVRSYQAWLSHPRSVSIDLVAPVREELRVTEPPSPLDPLTGHPELEPGYIAYSASGDVTASVVYANYGLPPDYAALAARGVDVRGKLVLVRYARSHRAVKVHTAERAGAAGVVLYSDPADDGAARGDTWPGGYWRTATQLQRGNAKYSWFWHGDPLTPGVGATASAPRVAAGDAPTLPRIPVGVLAWHEARKIKDRLDGGATDVRVRLNVRMRDGLDTIRNVIARVPGARLADRGVLLGTHHDAWTFGGVDPGTGMAMLLEVARGLGALRRSGWQPLRTITLAFWDAEEYGLIGSTEHAEERARELREQVVLYVNSDLYTNGRFENGGTPSLRDFLVEVARDVPDGAGTVYDGWRSAEWAAQPPGRRARGADTFEVDLRNLGSGADFVAFQDFLGLPTLSLEFSATGGYGYGPYHSNYDTRFFVERVADPGFRRGALLAQVVGTVALRMGESQVLPYRFSHYAARLDAHLAEVPGWAQPADAPALSDAIGSLRAAIRAMGNAARDVESGIDRTLASDSPREPARLNDLLARLEQRFLDERSPARDRWYRHVIFGWDIYALYAGQAFPGVAAALRVGDRAAALAELGAIAERVTRVTAGLREAAALVR
jgi:hypothetical protein